MTVRKMNVTPINNFDFNGNNIFTIEIDNKVWFWGKQIANLLDYSNPYQAIKSHVRDKHVKTLKQSASQIIGEAEMLWKGNDHSAKTLIDISGIYSLVLRSNLPQAEDFQDWVTDEVLPSIQRTGGYQVEHKPMTLDEKLAVISSSSLETRNKVKQNTADIKELKDTFPISNSQQQELNQLEHAIVIKHLGGIDSNAYEHLKGKAFAQCWRDFKRHFSIPRYNELPKVKFEQGKKYLHMWAPDTDLRIKIKEANGQLSMV